MRFKHRVLIAGLCLAALTVGAAETKKEGAMSSQDPKATEVWSPIPPKVTPGATAGAPPSDAIVLFDGKSLAGWKSANGGEAQWRIDQGELVVAPGTGDIQTKQNFGDVQLDHSHEVRFRNIWLRKL